MKEFVREFFFDGIRQVFGWSAPRYGRLSFTNHALLKMHEYGLSTQTITDAFRFGEEIESGKIIRVYSGYLVGLIYKVTQRRVDCKRREVRNVVITCWKGVRSG